MSKIITHCPSCRKFNLNISKIDCLECGTRFEGQFDIPAILRLNDEDLAFIMAFVKCSGSLKDMAKQLDISYPTLRNRLNLLIETIRSLEDTAVNQRDYILQQLEKGTITAIEAAEQLKKLS